MVNLNNRFGRAVNRRLKKETIIWLTTIDSQNRPQPRPVWFLWDGKTVLLFSEAQAAKVRHIRNNPLVALNLNSDSEGAEVTVLLGRARILKRAPERGRLQAYMQKYREGIASLGMTPDSFGSDYNTAIEIKPTALRGF